MSSSIQAPPLTSEEIESMLKKNQYVRICTHNKDGTIHARAVSTVDYYVMPSGGFSYIEGISQINSPAQAILSYGFNPLFLVSTYGKGRVFVDLTNGGIGYKDSYDNRRVVRNALMWLKGEVQEMFQISIGSNIFATNVTTNSIVSNFELNEISKTRALIPSTL